MVKKLSASALACALVFFCAPFAPSQENKSENSGFLINYEEIMEDDISMINLPARHERRLAQNETIRNHDGCLAFYSDFKDFVQEKTGLRYGVDISYTAQRVAPGGKNTAVQGIYYPYAVWNIFNDTKFGSGQIDFNYNLVRYWGLEAGELDSRVGVASAINDYPDRQDVFSQLSYTHTMPGSLAWLSLTVGQFPLYNFDGTSYDSNQQTGLINYALSQNASASYPSAGLGAYLSAALSKEITLSGGYQSASNISGSRIKFKEAFDGDYTGFASLNYSDESGQYGLMGYYQPSTEEQKGYSWGWSFNAEENLGGKWSAFGRANGSVNNITPVKQSYVLGLSYRNPLDRNPLDAITVAAAYNRLSAKAADAPYVRTGETVFEAQWVWGLGKCLTITPDVQFYPEAGLNAEREWITVAGLRTTFMF